MGAKRIKTEDDEYKAKRERNNLAVQKSRKKAKENSDKLAKEFEALRENNKKLEGMIEVQERTKILLRELFESQLKSKNIKLNPAEQKYIDEITKPCQINETSDSDANG